MNARRDDRRRPTTEPTPSEAGEVTDATAASADDMADFEAGDTTEAVPFSERAKTPNPLEAAYLASRDGATEDAKGVKHGVQKRVPPEGRAFPSEDRAKKAVNLIRRAATENDGGAKTVIKERDGGHVVFFAWRPRSARKYTTDEVRAWAKEQGITLPAKGRVPKDVTARYRAAHGIDGNATPAPSTPSGE